MEENKKQPITYSALDQLYCPSCRVYRLEVIGIIFGKRILLKCMTCGILQYFDPVSLQIELVDSIDAVKSFVKHLTNEKKK